jgi:hypothetical protein
VLRWLKTVVVSDHGKGTLDVSGGTVERWQRLFIDEIDTVTADHRPTWQTPDKYNPARLSNSAVDIAHTI